MEEGEEQRNRREEGGQELRGGGRGEVSGEGALPQGTAPQDTSWELGHLFPCRRALGKNEHLENWFGRWSGESQNGGPGACPWLPCCSLQPCRVEAAP